MRLEPQPSSIIISIVEARSSIIIFEKFKKKCPKATQQLEIYYDLG